MNSQGLSDSDITAVFLLMVQNPKLRDSDAFQKAFVYILETRDRLHPHYLRALTWRIMNSREIDDIRKQRRDERARRNLESRVEHGLVSGRWRGVGEIRKPSSILEDLVSRDGEVSGATDKASILGARMLRRKTHAIPAPDTSRLRRKLRRLLALAEQGVLLFDPFSPADLRERGCDPDLLEEVQRRLEVLREQSLGCGDCGDLSDESTQRAPSPSCEFFDASHTGL